MQATSLCVTCPHRDLGFCGALLGKPSKELDLHQTQSWRRSGKRRPGEQVVTQNEASDEVFVLCGGWAFRYLQLANGGRQILNFLLPGDLFSVASVFAQQFHYSVGALTEIQFSGFRRASVIAKYAGNLEIAKALANACMTEIKNADELVSVLGQRSAEERVAYLLLHLMKRVAAQSVIRENRYPFPLRQQHIADAVGLTTVHVSRVMSLLRDRGIVELSNGVLQVLDLAELDRLGSVGT